MSVSKIAGYQKATHNAGWLILGEMSYFEATVHDYGQPGKKKITYLFCTLINICGIKDTVNYIGDYKFPFSLSTDNLILRQRISPKDCMYFWSN